MTINYCDHREFLVVYDTQRLSCPVCDLEEENNLLEDTVNNIDTKVGILEDTEETLQAENINLQEKIQELE